MGDSGNVFSAQSGCSLFDAAKTGDKRAEKHNRNSVKKRKEGVLFITYFIIIEKSYFISDMVITLHQLFPRVFCDTNIFICLKKHVC